MRLKRLFDVTVMMLALLFLAPVLFTVALLVRLKLGAPVLFRRQRSGLHGKPFTLSSCTLSL
jgi:sugar transferase EpsL